MTKLSVIITSLQDKGNLENLLEDLCIQQFKDFEVVVMYKVLEDGKLEKLKEYEAKLSKLSFQKVEENSKAKARNEGVQLAQCKRLVFLDDNVRIKPNFLGTALIKLEDSNLEVASAYLGIDNNAFAYKLANIGYNTALFIGQYFYASVSSGVIFSTKRVHKEINGFDESISVCEDSNYVKKASKKWRFRVLNLSFLKEDKSFEKEGLFKTLYKQSKTVLKRIFFGEIKEARVSSSY